jgi:hypothetical protein
MSRASKCDGVVFLNRTTKLFVKSFHDVSGRYMLTHPIPPKKRTEGGGKRGGKGKEEKRKTRIVGENII